MPAAVKPPTRTQCKALFNACGISRLATDVTRNAYCSAYTDAGPLCTVPVIPTVRAAMAGARAPPPPVHAGRGVAFIVHHRGACLWRVRA